MEKDVEKVYTEKVKNYVALRPESTKVQVSANTGIPIEFIEKEIADGKFEEHNGYLRVTRKKGMNSKRRNELAKKFAEQLQCDVEPLNMDNYKKPDSQLVIDLKKRYGSKIKSEDEKSL